MRRNFGINKAPMVIEMTMRTKIEMATKRNRGKPVTNTIIGIRITIVMMKL